MFVWEFLCTGRWDLCLFLQRRCLNCLLVHISITCGCRWSGQAIAGGWAEEGTVACGQEIASEQGKATEDVQSVDTSKIHQNRRHSTIRTGGCTTAPIGFAGDDDNVARWSQFALSEFVLLLRDQSLGQYVWVSAQSQYIRTQLFIISQTTTDEILRDGNCLDKWLLIMWPTFASAVATGLLGKSTPVAFNMVFCSRMLAWDKLCPNGCTISLVIYTFRVVHESTFFPYKHWKNIIPSDQTSTYTHSDVIPHPQALMHAHMGTTLEEIFGGSFPMTKHSGGKYLAQ